MKTVLYWNKNDTLTQRVLCCLLLEQHSLMETDCTDEREKLHLSDLELLRFVISSYLEGTFFAPCGNYQNTEQ